MPAPLHHYGRFAWDVGDLVQLSRHSPIYTVHWRGWVMIRHNGISQRQAVYWLGPAFWDCTWEADLYDAGYTPPDNDVYGAPWQ